MDNCKRYSQKSSKKLRKFVRRGLDSETSENFSKKLKNYNSNLNQTTSSMKKKQGFLTMNNSQTSKRKSMGILDISNYNKKKTRQNKYKELFLKNQTYKKNGDKRYEKKIVRNSGIDDTERTTHFSTDRIKINRSGVLNLSMKPTKQDSIKKLKLQTFKNFMNNGPQSTTFRGSRKLEEFGGSSITERNSLSSYNFMKNENSKRNIEKKFSKTKNENFNDSERTNAFFKKWMNKKKLKSSNLLKKVRDSFKLNLRVKKEDELRKSRSSSELCSYRNRTKA